MSINGPATMYVMKPLFKLDDEIKVETGMYKMKNLHSTDQQRISTSSMLINGTYPDLKENEPDPLDAVQLRQQVLLKRIADLKKLLDSIASILRSPGITKNPKIAVDKSQRIAMVAPNFQSFGVTHDIVLNVDPQYPIYSLLALDKLFDYFSNVKYEWHLHSSVRNLPDAAKSFQAKLSSSAPIENAPLKITIVWKNVGPDCELVVSPLKTVPLLGEVNFLRFINKVSLTPLDSGKQLVFDEKLDTCHALNHTNTQREAEDLLKKLSDGLKTEWLMGNSLSVVDLAAWSAIKRLKKPNLDAKLNKWFQTCESYVTNK